MTDEGQIRPTADRSDTSVAEPEEDFAALFEASARRTDTRIQRDAKIDGTVVSIGDEWIFVDIGGKSEGVIARDELTGADGKLTLEIGSPISAYAVNVREGDVLLSVKMTAAASEEAIRGAQRSGVPVEGLVSEERKGGYGVAVLGKQAFCPYSQIDLPPAGSADDYIGKRFLFRITEYSDKGRNIVLSRRNILEEERRLKVEQLKQSLKPGDVVEGIIKNVTSFGAFADIGGIQALIPISELAWYRVSDPAEIVSVNQTVQAVVLDVDWAKNRISLSLKQTTLDPWDSVLERYSGGRRLTGRVTRLMNYGAFVELEPGIEGMIHVSRMGTGRRLNHAKEVLSEGQIVDAVILAVEADARRISLELDVPREEGAVEESVELKPGDMVSGVVEAIKDFGVFLRLPGGKTGLLHVSEIDETVKGDIKKRFLVGSQVEVEILSIDSDSEKIALSTKTLRNRSEKNQFKDYATQQSSSTRFGTFADLLKDKLGS